MKINKLQEEEEVKRKTLGKIK